MKSKMKHFSSLFFYDQSSRIFLLKRKTDNGAVFEPIKAEVHDSDNADGALIRVLRDDFNFDLKDFHFFKKYIANERVEEVFTGEFPGFNALNVVNGAGTYSIDYALSLKIDEFYKTTVLRDLRKFVER